MRSVGAWRTSGRRPGPRMLTPRPMSTPTPLGAPIADKTVKVRAVGPGVKRGRAREFITSPPCCRRGADPVTLALCPAAGGCLSHLRVCVGPFGQVSFWLRGAAPQHCGPAGSESVAAGRVAPRRARRSGAARAARVALLLPSATCVRARVEGRVYASYARDEISACGQARRAFAPGSRVAASLRARETRAWRAAERVVRLSPGRGTRHRFVRGLAWLRAG